MDTMCSVSRSVCQYAKTSEGLHFRVHQIIASTPTCTCSMLPSTQWICSRSLCRIICRPQRNLVQMLHLHGIIPLYRYLSLQLLGISILRQDPRSSTPPLHPDPPSS